MMSGKNRSSERIIRSVVRMSHRRPANNGRHNQWQTVAATAN